MNLKEWNKELLRVLTLFDGATRARGAEYYREGRVYLDELYLGEKELSCAAKVRGKKLYTVNLLIDKNGLTDTRCSCPVAIYCKHIYASLRSAQSRVEQLLSEADISREQTRSREEKARDELVRKDLHDVMEKAQGRKLNLSQRRRVERIHEKFKKMRKIRATGLTLSDLSEMGLRFDGFPWEEIGIWDSFADVPESLVDFWLTWIGVATLANAKIMAEVNLPYDMTRVRELMDFLRKKMLEENFQDFYQRLTENLPSKNSLPVRTSADLTLRVMKSRVDLEGIFSAIPKYRNLDTNDLDYLWGLYCGERVFLDSGSKVILENFMTVDQMYSQASLSLQNELHVQAFRNILQSPAARLKVLTRSGKPYQWEEEKLEWFVERAPHYLPESDEEWYSVALKWASGREVPAWQRYIEGNPTYYLSATSIACGPVPNPGIFDINKPNMLPGNWVTRPQTQQAFKALGIRFIAENKSEGEAAPAPVIRPTVRFRAWLESDEHNNEHCEVSVAALDPDTGRELLYYGATGWHYSSARKAGESGDRGAVTDVSEMTLDDTSIGIMPSVMRPLQPEFNTGDNVFMTPVNRNFPDAFHEWLTGLPRDAIVELDPQLSGFRDGHIRGSIGVKVEKSGTDWFDVELVMDTGGYELTDEEKKILLKAPGTWVRLKSGDWRRLDFEISDEDDSQLARLGLSPEELNEGPQKAHAIQLADEVADDWIEADRLTEIRNRAAEIRAEVNPDIPAGVTATLRPYQTEGYHFLSYLSHNNFGGILADDMGLGKTLQTLTWLKHLQDNPEVPDAPVLVVCPKSVMDNWAHEVEQFVPGVEVNVWDPSVVRSFAAQSDRFEVHVINYAQLRNLGDRVNRHEWLAVILDEAQNIKNPGSQAAKAACQLNSRYRLALTGTPIENRLTDLWSIMHFAMPGILGSQSRFQTLYNAKKDQLARVRLSARIRPFILRRTKDQVARDLPERVEEDIYCALSGEQERMYRAELKRAQQIMLKVRTASEFNKIKFNVLTSLLRLRQICCHPKLYQSSSRGKSSKMEALVDHVEVIMDEGSKVLVFSQFVEMLEILSTEARKKGWRFWSLTGQTENRGQLVQEFQKTEGPGVFFISLKAGGAGLNLTSAQYVVLFDPWWNPAVENQAIDRTHRIGQTNRVVAYRLLAKNTVEEKIRELQKKKSELAAEVLDESRFSESLSMEDLEYIFRDDREL